MQTSETQQPDDGPTNRRRYDSNFHSSANYIEEVPKSQNTYDDLNI